MKYINQQGSYLPMYKGRYKVSDVCQLLDKSKYPATQTDSGITFTNNGDGTITVNGTCTNPYYSVYKIKENLDGIISGHKYAILGTGTNVNVAFSAGYQGGYIWKVANNIFTLPENEYTSFSSQIRITAGVSVSNITVKPQLFDLTEMYGAGNEPTTVEEFRQKYPNELYPYSPYCWAKMKQMRYKVSDVCQLLDKSQYPATQTINGVTFTNNGDGSITANGTATKNTTLLFGFEIPYPKNHITLIIGCPSDGNGHTYYMTTTFGNDYGKGLIKKQNNNYSGGNCYIVINANTVVSNLVFKPQLFDLTEMYGAGNEPTTVEEFREKFPDELYSYSPKCYLPLK